MTLTYLKPPTASGLRARRPGRPWRVFESSALTAELSYDPAIKVRLRFLTSVLALPTAGHAQSGVRPQPTPAPTQTPTDGVARLFTEEAYLPAFTADERGRLNPSLEILAVPQPAGSVRRNPG